MAVLAGHINAMVMYCIKNTKKKKRVNQRLASLLIAGVQTTYIMSNYYDLLKSKS